MKKGQFAPSALELYALECQKFETLISLKHQKYET